MATNRFKSLFCLLLYSAIVTETSIGGPPGSTKVEEQENLTCYRCNSQLDGEECRFTHNMTRVMVHKCPASSRFCSVTRVDYSLDPSVTRPFSIERNCSDHCTTECVVVGERLRLHLCRSCCRLSLCNVGDGASTLRTSDVLQYYVFSAFVAYICGTR
ncbi:uncharacterized protein LOC135367803 [Ornithodoros turicata]|uniref:uncharacterized protein LOC135367803 n=1 Tax=Ornithodoros turicata TaxID=34597 RepID=UPI00313876E7